LEAKVVVYTAIFEDYDALIPHTPSDGVRFICFTDSEELSAEPWEVRVVECALGGRRENRRYKILAHNFIDADYSIYVDGNVKLLVDPKELVSRYLAGSPVALFRHPFRACLYDEGNAIAKAGLDDPEIVLAQLERYHRAGYPEKNGLHAGNVILRRHIEEVARFNELWWQEYSRGCERDQVCLDYALWKVGLIPTEIPPPWPGVGKHSEFAYFGHGDHG